MADKIKDLFHEFFAALAFTRGGYRALMVQGR